jgi:HAD superfamily hydrolase (TIGR01509 family)
LKAVVFDFDGVLVRSMELHAEAFRQTLAPLGVHIRNEDVFELEGGRSESLIEEFLRRAGRTTDRSTIQRLGDQKQSSFARLGPPKLYPGAEAMVRGVREKAQKLGIVTGSRKENLERLIPGLLPLFDAVLAQNAYQKDKPDPEPYLKAAQALQLPPSECAALENARFGVRSAVAAGYAWVVGITTTTDAEVLSRAGAHVVVPDHVAAAEALLSALDR